MKDLLFMVLLLSSHWVFAQNSNSTPTLPETGVKTSILGSIVYPGLKVGLERPFKVIQVDKQKKNHTKTILKERYWTGNLGFYHHPNFHDNLYVLIERQKRRQYTNGWFTEAAPGLGFSRTFLGGETYEVAANGEVDKLNLAGHNYALASLSVGMGYNFAIQGGQDVKLFAKTSLLGLFPSNSDIYLRPTLELGMVLSTADLWTAHPHLIHKQKNRRK